jgi:uncharacterized protein (TIGR03435 family)
MAWLDAQTVDPSKPKFEVASVKRRAEPIFSPGNNRNFGGVFVRESTTLERLILYAYDLRDYQLVGGPAWVRSPVLFEVAASAGKDVPEAELRLMVQSMLGDRFRLVAHHEKREMPIYDLVLARSDGRLGPGLTKKLDDDCTKPTSASAVRSVRPVGASGCGQIARVANVARGLMRAPVADKTGLVGTYEFVMFYSTAGADGQPLDPSLTEFPTALQEQLGLRLEASRGLVDVLVIDAVEQPTEN